ncbi:MAG: polysaccharide pyruvyl transferase family protein [Candidatus Bathyarchaeota archaeon]|nr:polysaccharide pyruvyl transferase family protein [Candidatus Bathyarchaeota archaeon]
MEKFHVGISGSYGGLNLGDEAILQSIVSQLRASVDVEITVFSRNPPDTVSRHQVEKVVDHRKLTRLEVTPDIKQLDLFILGGGGIFFDKEIDIFLRDLELAQQNNVPTMVYAVGAGPLNNENSRRRVREVLSNVDVITVREKEAKKVLEEVGVQHEILVTADPAFLLEPESLSKNTLKLEQVHGKRPLVGISVREPGPAAPDINPNFYHVLLANAADFVISRLDADVIFVPMERQVFDVQHSHAVIAKMLRPQHAWVLKGEYTPGQLLTLIENFCFTIGMRLHFLIFSALQGVPFVPLPYASKVTGFLDNMQMPMPPLNEVDSGLLNAFIDKAWDERDRTKQRIHQLLPNFKRLAAENNRFAVELLTHKTADLTFRVPEVPVEGREG